jgi:SAM-dependent methyltransferase
VLAAPVSGRSGLGLDGLATFHNRTLRSAPPTASVRPSWITFGNTTSSFRLWPAAKRIEHWNGRLRPLLPDRLVHGASILDVGFGTGEVAFGLVARGAHMVCADVTRSALRTSRQLNPAYALCQTDACALPFLDSTFDHAIAIGVLHHSTDCRRALNKMARVTPPGGRGVVLLYARLTPYHVIYQAAQPLRSRIRSAPSTSCRSGRSGCPRVMIAAQVGQWLGNNEYWTHRSPSRPSPPRPARGRPMYPLCPVSHRKSM